MERNEDDLGGIRISLYEVEAFGRKLLPSTGNVRSSNAWGNIIPRVEVSRCSSRVSAMDLAFRI